MSTTAKIEIHRILVSLNAAFQEDEVIDIGSRLAEMFQAELAGLYIEDVDLLNLAELPFLMELHRSAIHQRAIEQARLQRWVRGRAERARQALSDRLQGRAIKWHFDQVRGRVVNEMVLASQAMDLLVLGRHCEGAMIRSRRGEEISAIIRQAPCSVLIASQQPIQGLPVYAFYHDTAESERSLLAAASFARMEGAPLYVVLPVANGAQRLDVELHVAELVKSYDIETHFVPVGADSSIEWVNTLSTAVLALLVLDYQAIAIHEEILDVLVRWLSCPILVIK